ncbi:MAG: hypothetical protein IKV64_05660 [Clostridia bacterium]|nr:hypothetical protein [Clostridia bacterium]
MRETTKMTIPYQFKYILLQHLSGCAIAFVLMMVFSWAFDKSPLKEILSALFIIIYAFMLYHGANELAVADNKSYSRLKPNVFKSFLWGVAICAITFILFTLYTLVWKYLGTDGGINFIVTVLTNFVFSIWTYPYVGIIGASKGYVMMYSFPFWVIVPIASTMVGYIAGCRGFLLGEHIQKLVYRQEKKDK